MCEHKLVHYSRNNHMDTPLAPTADCEVHGVKRFLTAKDKSATDIHCEVCTKNVKTLCQGQRSLVGVNFLLKEEQHCMVNNKAATPQLLTTPMLSKMSESLSLIGA